MGRGVAGDDLGGSVPAAVVDDEPEVGAIGLFDDGVQGKPHKLLFIATGTDNHQAAAHGCHSPRPRTRRHQMAKTSKAQSCRLKSRWPRMWASAMAWTAARLKYPVAARVSIR